MASMQERFAKEHFTNVAKAYERVGGGATRKIAKHLVALASPIEPNARILDNACGPGVVIDEILASVTDAPVKDSLKITAADAAQPMLDQLALNAETKWQLPSNQLEILNLPAEQLDSIPSDSFDYSFTNFGFQFFRDVHKAAEQVHRTLAPRGKAFITAWNDLGYIKSVMQAAAEIRPTEPPPQNPTSKEWTQPGYLGEILEKAGFADVKVHQQESTYSATSMSELCQILTDMLKGFLKMQGWKDDELEKLPRALEAAFDKDPEVLVIEEHQVHVKMVANVAVCVK